MEEKKQCKYCKSEMDKNAKICPTCRKKQEIKGWQIFLIIVAILLVLIVLTNMENDNQSQPTTTLETVDSSMTTATQKEEVKEEINRYKLNDEVVLWNNTEEYTITINSIKEMDERNEFSEKEPAQVFLIDYTYKNIKGDELYISEYNFTIIDQEGEVGGTYPNIISKYPKSVPEGASCKAQMVLCVNNKSDKIELHYKDNMFQDRADIIFEIEV